MSDNIFDFERGMKIMMEKKAVTSHIADLVTQQSEYLLEEESVIAKNKLLEE